MPPKMSIITKASRDIIFHIFLQLGSYRPSHDKVMSSDYYMRIILCSIEPGNCPRVFGILVGTQSSVCLTYSSQNIS